MDPRRIAITLVVLLASLTACSDNKPAPTVTPTPTASSSPTPTETTEPTAEPESAEDFVRRWFDLHNELSATGESSEFRRVSKQCSECLGVATLYEEIYANGGSVEGGVITVLSTRRLNRDEGEETWIAQLRATPTRYRESADSQPKTIDGGRAAYRLVIREGPDYTVTELFQESL